MTSLPTLLTLLGLLLVIGAFAGVISGLLGVGGGIVLVPAFFYVFTALGYEGSQVMQVCLATSLATIVFTSIRSVTGHHKRGSVDTTILRTWAPGIVIGAAIGVLTVSSLRSDVLQFAFGILAFIVGLYMALGRAHWQIAPEMPKGLRRAALSPAVGFLSVLMGIGGGSFGVPLMSLHGVPTRRAVGTAAGFGLLIAVPSVLGFLFVSVDAASRPPYTLGAVNIPAFLAVISMTLLTAPLGVKLAHSIDQPKLKRIFAVFLLLVALNMLRGALFG